MYIICMFTDIIYHCIIINLTILEVVIGVFSRELIKCISSKEIQWIRL